MKSILLPAALLFVYIAIGVACSSNDGRESRFVEEIEGYSIAVADRDSEAVRGYFNPRYADACEDETLESVLRNASSNAKFEIAQFDSAEEGSTEKVTATVTGPWGLGAFVIRFAEPETNYLADPILFDCLRLAGEQALDILDEIDPIARVLYTELRTLYPNFWNDDGQVLVGLRKDGLEAAEASDDYVGRLDILRDLAELLPDAKELRNGFPSTPGECRALYTYDQCEAIGLAQTIVYSGPYTFSGSDGDSRTDTFCLTGEELAVEYASHGVGQFPDIYFLTVWVYDEFDNYVDSSIGLEGAGNWETSAEPPGCYYLEVNSFSAEWSIIVEEVADSETQNDQETNDAASWDIAPVLELIQEREASDFSGAVVFDEPMFLELTGQSPPEVLITWSSGGSCGSIGEVWMLVAGQPVDITPRSASGFSNGFQCGGFATGSYLDGGTEQIKVTVRTYGGPGWDSERTYCWDGDAVVLARKQALDIDQIPIAPEEIIVDSCR